MNMFKDFSDELSESLNILTVLKTFYDCGIPFSDTDIKTDFLFSVIIEALFSLGCWSEYDDGYDRDIWYICPNELNEFTELADEYGTAHGLKFSENYWFRKLEKKVRLELNSVIDETGYDYCNYDHVIRSKDSYIKIALYNGDLPNMELLNMTLSLYLFLWKSIKMLSEKLKAEKPKIISMEQPQERRAA